jgi:hypothetical protein
MTVSNPANTFITETAQFVRHYPLGVAAAAFGGGVFIGWLISYNLKTRLSSGREQRPQKVDEVKAYKRAISRWEGEGGAIPSISKGGKK